MDFCLHLTGRSTRASRSSHDPRPDFDMSRFEAALPGIGGMRRALVHCPELPHKIDPLLATPDATPWCVIQLYFDGLAKLESSLLHGGPLWQALRAATSGIAAAEAYTQQAMAVRRYAVPECTTTPSTRTSYLVSYEGHADDFDTWLAHYLDHHSPLMLQLPGLRELEVCTRLDYRSDLPLPRAHAMQRNKVVFDDKAALSAALASPIRAAMRKDYEAFPAFHGETPHFPMRTVSCKLSRVD